MTSFKAKTHICFRIIFSEAIATWLVGGNSPPLNLVLDGVFILIYRPNGPVWRDGRFCFCNGDYLVPDNSITRFDWIHCVVRGIISGRDNDLLYPEICISQSVTISQLKRFSDNGLFKNGR